MALRTGATCEGRSALRPGSTCPVRAAHQSDRATHRDDRATRREGLSWAFAGVLMFSFSVPLTKVAVGGFSPFFTATGRAVIAGIVAALLLAARRVPLPERRHLRPLLFTMLGAVFGWPILVALALERTTSAHVAVIAAFMPLTTALIAVVRTHERVSRQFWAAALAGTATLVAFALLRGGAHGADLTADALVVGAVLASSWCYVEGASVTRSMPGWQVISWVVVFALPVTVPASAVLWWRTSGGYDTSAGAWTALALLGISSMYLGFFAWYRGLALAGIARGGQVQQLQALLTLVWSALLLGEHVTAPTVLAALAVIASVIWAQGGREPQLMAPLE
jgi:drug/metabolite transporter (DMT)-like permease